MGKRKSNKKRKGISIFHIILAVLSVYVVVTFINQEFVIRDLNKQNKVADTDLKDLKENIKNLEKKIDKSETVEYIERIAREELDMVKPNEIIYKDKDKQEDKGDYEDNKEDKTEKVDWQISKYAVY